MRDILPFLSDAVARGRSVAWARVISTWGSAPRRPGAALAVVSPTEFAGSVSGGCVEDAVIDEALGCLAAGRSQVVEYGIRDDVAWSAGLSCGGIVRVLVEPFPVTIEEEGTVGVGQTLLDSLMADRPVVLATPLDGSGDAALLGETGLLVDGVEPPDGLAESAIVALARRAPQEVEVDGLPWFVQPLPARERLILVGGSDIAVRLTAMARALDFETIQIDPRGVLSRAAEVPDRIITGDAATAIADMAVGLDDYVVLLTHDPSVDDPVLRCVLNDDVAYVGALGGRKTQEKRRNRLQAAGFDTATLDLIDGPVGVPIGAVTPAEIAVSIAARLVETRRRRLG